MCKILTIIVLTIILLSCKKENSTQNTNNTTTNNTLGKYGNGVIDIDGNKYKTVIIGNQEWMGENLNVTRFNDGNKIPNIVESKMWANFLNEAWCNYNNNDSIGSIYGKLYNWEVVNNNKNVCPIGWRIPNKTDWDKLFNTIGGSNIAGSPINGSALREMGQKHWLLKDTSAFNSTLFSSLPAGLRTTFFDSSLFHQLGYYTCYWSTTNLNNDIKPSFSVILKCGEGQIPKSYISEQTLFGFSYLEKSSGISIRCIKE